MTSILSSLSSFALLSNIEPTDSRLFGLDMALLIDAAFVMLSTFFLFILLGYLLFEPVKQILDKRTEKIRTDIKQATEIKESAVELKTSYEMKLREVDKEAEAILSDSRKKALDKEREIAQRAEEEAERILARARLEIQREKEQAKDDMRKEIIAVATIMASKFVVVAIDEDKKKALVAETIEGMGEDTWLN
ncbi:MAG: F0F1 ATP synthase subunit B [Vallitaleaceae bacterium]|nr:F0F1 ATP synthase subunit B [Vallitaleaceae bacterium]